MTDFETHPSRYVHWRLQVDGAVARLVMGVAEDRPFRPGYRLKLNSYDLGVDIELADAVQRLRFEHPQVRVVVITSGNPRVFCAGANIGMLGQSSHGFKVNFCKFTNETRCAIEDASSHSGQRYVAALNGTASGGGYELAAACDEIWLQDDGNSAVSLPEVPLLGVLPGTGGLTRLVDKRKVRRDLADVFSTLAEGCKAKKAKEWGLIDGSFPRSRFEEGIAKRAAEIAAQQLAPKLPDKTNATGVVLPPLEPKVGPDSIEYRHVSLKLDRARRLAELTIHGPNAAPGSLEELVRLGADLWPLRAYRELDDAISRLRFDEEEIGLVVMRTRTRGDLRRTEESLLRTSDLLARNRSHWFVNEVVLFMGRVLRRVDLTAKSLFTLIDEHSVTDGNLAELALAADRIYMRNDPAKQAVMAFGPLSSGALPMSNGLTRLQVRFLADPVRAEKIAREMPRLETPAAMEMGLVTSAPDALDWEQETRLAIEERLSLSPDALTGMEASLRFGGPETLDSKIYGRLSAWQNWIFIRPNATGEHGALKLYGQPERPKFDWRRT